jgi:predicted SAM-dependent methyltransferase
MKQESICLNLGCGLEAPKEWLNIDSLLTLKFSKIPLIGRPLISKLGGPNWPKSVKLGDITRGLPLSENSCELIFASHVLEHLSWPDSQNALKNIFFYLQPGGTFRVIVPDLEKIVTYYQNSSSQDSDRTRAAHEFMSVSGIGCQSSRTTWTQRLAEAFSNSRHQWMWDEFSLSDDLVRHGFKQISRCKYGEWSDSRFASVEKPDRHIDAVCLEASK